MKKFKVKINLPKVDGYRNGRRSCDAQVEAEWRLEVKYEGGKPSLYWEFSACGALWNNLHTDWMSGGQNLDHLNEYAAIRAVAKFREVYDLWTKYHLNGMTAGSPAQESAKKDFKVNRDGITWTWYDKSNITENTDCYGLHVTDNEATAKSANKAGYGVTKHVGDYHDQLHIFLVRRGLYTDHSFMYDGEPYKYGHAWLVTEIPEADKKRIRALLGITRADEVRAEAEARRELETTKGAAA